MTVKLLVDWKDPSTGRQYRIGNLLDTDDYTEAGLIASKQAQADLTGGTAQTDPVVNHGDGPVVRTNAAGTALVVNGNDVPIAGIPCEAFGASPSASAAVNTAAIQAALDVAGRVTLILPGIYKISKTLLINSGTHMLIGKGVTLQLDQNANCNLIRNKSAGVRLQAANFVRVSNVVTVTENGHTRAVGDWVLISDLLTDTSFNGLVQVVSVSANSWTYSSTGSNGSPTGYGAINPAFNQLTASAFSSSSNTVTVTEAGHRRKIGNPVFIANLATNTSFNGTFQITDVTSSTWTYIKTGADTAPTGTAVVLGDNDISFEINGTIDGNTVNQSGVNNYSGSTQSFGVILGNIGNVTRKGGTYINQRKYAWWFFNATDVVLETSYFNTLSDGNHFEAPADRIVVRDQFGSALDDVVSFTNVYVGAAGYPGYASPSGLGDFGSAVIDGIYPSQSQAPSQVKYAGYAGYTFKNLEIRNIKGTIHSGGGAGVVLVDDTACLTGGSLDNFIFDGVAITGGSASSKLLSISLSGTIGAINISNVKLTGKFAGVVPFGFNNATVDAIHFRNIDAKYSAFANLQMCNVYSGTVNLLTCANSSFTNTSSSGIIFTAQGTATLKTVALDNIRCYNVDSLFKHNSSTVTTDTVFANNVMMDAVANGISVASSGLIMVDNVHYTNGVNHLFQIAGGTVKIRAKNLVCAAGTVALFNYGGSSISYSSPDQASGIDLGANAGSPPAGLVPIAGDVIWNTNATGTGLYGYTAAGAWAKVF